MNREGRPRGSSGQGRTVAPIIAKRHALLDELDATTGPSRERTDILDELDEPVCAGCEPDILGEGHARAVAASSLRVYGEATGVTGATVIICDDCADDAAEH